MHAMAANQDIAANQDNVNTNDDLKAGMYHTLMQEALNLNGSASSRSYLGDIRNIRLPNTNYKRVRPVLPENSPKLSTAIQHVSTDSGPCKVLGDKNGRLNIQPVYDNDTQKCAIFQVGDEYKRPCAPHYECALRDRNLLSHTMSHPCHSEFLFEEETLPNCTDVSINATVNSCFSPATTTPIISAYCSSFGISRDNVHKTNTSNLQSMLNPTSEFTIQYEASPNCSDISFLDDLTGNIITPISSHSGISGLCVDPLFTSGAKCEPNMAAKNNVVELKVDTIEGPKIESQPTCEFSKFNIEAVTALSRTSQVNLPQNLNTTSYLDMDVNGTNPATANSITMTEYSIQLQSTNLSPSLNKTNSLVESGVVTVCTQNNTFEIQQLKLNGTATADDGQAIDVSAQNHTFDIQELKLNGRATIEKGKVIDSHAQNNTFEVHQLKLTDKTQGVSPATNSMTEYSIQPQNTFDEASPSDTSLCVDPLSLSSSRAKCDQIMGVKNNAVDTIEGLKIVSQPIYDFSKSSTEAVIAPNRTIEVHLPLNINTTSCLDMDVKGTNPATASSITEYSVQPENTFQTNSSPCLNKTNSLVESRVVTDGAQNNTFEIQQLYLNGTATAEEEKAIESNAQNITEGNNQLKLTDKVTVEEEKCMDLSAQNNNFDTHPLKLNNPSTKQDRNSGHVSHQSHTSKTNPPLKFNFPTTEIEANARTVDLHSSMFEGMSVIYGNAKNLSSQSVDLGKIKVDTLSLDDTLEFNSMLPVTSTPMPHFKPRNFKVEQETDCVPPLRKEIPKRALTQPTTQLPLASNIVSDRKTFFKHSGLKSLQPPSGCNISDSRKTLLKLPNPEYHFKKSKQTSKTSGPSESSTSSLPMTRSRVRTEASIKAASDVLQEVTTVACSTIKTKPSSIVGSKLPTSGLRKPQSYVLTSATQRSSLRQPSAGIVLSSCSGKPDGIGEKSLSKKKNLSNSREALPLAKRIKKGNYKATASLPPLVKANKPDGCVKCALLQQENERLKEELRKHEVNPRN